MIILTTCVSSRVHGLSMFQARAKSGKWSNALQTQTPVYVNLPLCKFNITAVRQGHTCMIECFF